jgi:hypothetical protein
MDRLAWARGKGYDAALLALTDELDYPKNDVLVGIRGDSALAGLLDSAPTPRSL